MRYILSILLFLSIQNTQAQALIPDSTIKEFCRLTCECATLMKVDQGDPEKGFQNMGTCFNSTLEVYVKNGWVSKESLNDSVVANDFYNRVEKELKNSCPAFATMMEKANRQAPEPLTTINPKYFIPDAMMTTKGLVKSTNGSNSEMKRWNAKNMGTAKIQIVFDIRMVFNNSEDASAYLSIKEQELSEGGTVTDHNLKAFGADESKVFGENPKLAGAFGDIDMATYNFVFRVNKVVAKVFVSASKKATYEEALYFAKQAILSIKSVK